MQFKALPASLEVSCSFMYTTSLGGTLTLSYTGDANYKSSTAIVDPYSVLAVNKVMITSSLDPAPFGAPVTFSIRVITNELEPAGFALVTIPGRPLQKVALTKGAGTLELTDLPVGDTTLAAVYSADGAATTTVTGSYTQTVAKAATVLGLATSKSPIVRGDSVTLTATVEVVAPGAGTPTGMVRFFASDGSADQTLGEAALSAGVATLTTKSLAAGSIALRAEYVGDASFASSTGELPGGGHQIVGRALSTGCSTSGATSEHAASVLIVMFALAWSSRFRRRYR